jgi:hypothetical protein
MLSSRFYYLHGKGAYVTMNLLKIGLAIPAFLLLAFLLANCKKEFSYEGGSDGEIPAGYELETVGEFCDGQLNGSYTAGTPLDNSDTYNLKVSVLTAGYFSISTQTVNGVVFRYSGRFTSTGIQVVTLTGYGTPLAVGNFLLTPIITGTVATGRTACDFNLDVK